MKRLIHNGILVPKYEAKGFHIQMKGKQIALTPNQEEMAVAWVKKLGTEYVEDSVFVRNFFQDFQKALGIKEKLSPEDFDFTEIKTYVEKERMYKQNLSKEEKKRLMLERKAIREANKEKYGYAYIDEVKTEISNYMAEPSSIFMGRGKHPLRGQWKQGPTENDIILNLSPEAPTPPGNWKEIVWQPDSMWIAKWDDRLREKEKYVWLSDASHAKQMNDIKKFDKAWELATRIETLQRHIEANLNSEDVLRRKVATVSYLIDALKLRVGDEKDKDEADTVGATTLRPEHISIGTDGKVAFDFLGKDCVRWQKEAVFPEIVVSNLEEFVKSAHSTIFEGVKSRDVTLFFNEIMEGLTAKVFRTYHASTVVKEALEKADVPRHVPNYAKRHVALMANLTAAIVCNHKRKIPKNWRESLAKKRERLEKLRTAKMTEKRREALKVLQFKIREMKATRDYNLGTSLKSYIDPRIYYGWGKKVDFDWKLYYPKTLQKKFSWIENPRYNNSKIYS